jgi:hypothetical protein
METEGPRHQNSPLFELTVLRGSNDKAISMEKVTRERERRNKCFLLKISCNLKVPQTEGKLTKADLKIKRMNLIHSF